MSHKKYSENEIGRDIIDEIVVKNSHINTELFNNAQSYPPYFGGVSIGEKQVKLNAIKNRKSIGQQKLICDIINGTRNFKLTDGEGKIHLIYSDIDKKTVNVHPTLIKLIKTCVACSFNCCEDYSIVVSEFVKSLLDTIDNISYPINLPEDTKTQKIIAKELNEFLLEILVETNTSYSKVIEQPKKKKNNSIMGCILETAERICETDD